MQTLTAFAFLSSVEVLYPPAPSFPSFCALSSLLILASTPALHMHPTPHSVIQHDVQLIVPVCYKREGTCIKLHNDVYSTTPTPAPSAMKLDAQYNVTVAEQKTPVQTHCCALTTPPLSTPMQCNRASNTPYLLQIRRHLSEHTAALSQPPPCPRPCNATGHPIHRTWGRTG